MVNVPGRSSGCLTCRKRKVKCDETKPICRKCEQVGRDCLGYAKTTHFIHASAARPIAADGVASHSVGRPTLLLTYQKSIFTTIESLPPRSMSLIAWKSDMCTAFLFTNFVWTSYATPWLELAAQEKMNDEMLSSKTCQALTRYNYGKLHHQKDLEIEGSMRYGQAMKELAKRLSEAGTQLEVLIVPMLLMLMHAVSEAFIISGYSNVSENAAGDRTGASSHIQGLTKLLLVCGPSAFASEPYRNAFESCRATIITMHLVMRQRTFLETIEWKTEPWLTDPASKSHQNRISDVLVMIPGLLEDFQKYYSCPSADLYSDLVSRVVSEIERLFEWRWSWESEDTNSVIEILTNLTTSEARRGHNICESAIAFASAAQSKEIMLYNATLLWLLNLIWKLVPLEAHKLILDAAARTKKGAYIWSPLLRPGDTLSLRGPAIEICRCYEFQMTQGQRNQELSLFYMFPLALAGNLLEEDRQYSSWIRNMLDSSPITSGYGRNSSNLYGFRFYLTPQALA